MQFTKEQLRHVAQMARIKISDEEMEELMTDLNAILKMIQELDAVDTTNIPQIDQITGLKDVMEKDEIVPFLNPEKLVECSPLPQKDQMIRVHKTI